MEEVPHNPMPVMQTAEQSPNPTPLSLRRLFAVAFGAAAGVVFSAAMVIGIVFWYSSRPEPPKPWDTSSIVATYDGISTEGADKTFVFYYVLENKGARDYRLDSGSSTILMVQLERQKSLGAFGEHLAIDLPVFIPAGQRQHVEIHLRHSFSEPYPSKATHEQRKAYKAKLQKYLNEEAGNLNGFVIFDEINRYEIRLPKGW